MNEIFIFAQTRSGSTLLQRAINQTEDVIIYGEHGGMLNGYAAAYYSALDTGLGDARFKPKTLKDPKGFAPCLSCIDPIRFKSQTRKYFTALLNPEESFRWGFKEVRYEGGQVFEMLAELYPSAKFVFLVRDPREQIRSVMSMKWEKFNPAYAYWLNTFRYFHKCRTALPDRCRFITYQHLRRVQSLFDWLGLDNPRYDLFRQMPRTGRTENKIKLEPFYKWSIEQDCLTLFKSVVYDD